MSQESSLSVEQWWVGEFLYGLKRGVESGDRGCFFV
jgi:hypothetical protein